MACSSPTAGCSDVRNQITDNGGERDGCGGPPGPSQSACLYRHDFHARLVPCHAGRRGGFCARAVAASGVSLGGGASLGAGSALLLLCMGS